MDILTLSGLLGYQTGHIYQFTGSVPDGQDPNQYITSAFIAGVGDNGLATNVINVGGNIYFFSPVEATVNDFNYFGEALPEPVVAEESAPEEESSEEPSAEESSGTKGGE